MKEIKKFDYESLALGYNKMKIIIDEPVIKILSNLHKQFNNRK